MITDFLMQLWAAAALTSSAVSTDSYDLGAAGKEVGVGAEPMSLVFTVDVGADHTTGNETYHFDVIQSANSNLGSADVLNGKDILYSALTVGSVHEIPIPPGSVTKQYLGGNYVGGGTSPTVTVTGWIMPSRNVPHFKAYAKGYNS